MSNEKSSWFIPNKKIIFFKKIEKDNFRFGCYNSNKFSNERIFFDESIMPVTDFKIVDPWKLHGDI
jgi:hypothetical protein